MIRIVLEWYFRERRLRLDAYKKLAAVEKDLRRVSEEKRVLEVANRMLTDLLEKADDKS